ncbi:Zn-ribbon protein, possibly nucleic acid-binding [Thiovulum sp. ES]|nr:Zn-ribbon protein, possibly nucleic acid-binding [Thiovulum sp. ES]
MNIYLQKIIELSDIDNDIANFEPRIESVKKSYANVEDGRDEIVKSINSLKTTISEINKKIASHENEIAKAREQQKDYQQKMKTVSKEREITALEVESGLQKTNIEFNNNEIASLQKKIENFETQLKNKEEKLAQFEEETISAKNEMEEKLQNLDNQYQQIRVERDEMVAEIKEKKIIIFYNKIRRWAGETTVVPVKKQSCYGCFIKLADQKYLEIIRGEEIITCPNCGRILYLESTETE